jgi:hypothetical protein
MSAALHRLPCRSCVYTQNKNAPHFTVLLLCAIAMTAQLVRLK